MADFIIGLLVIAFIGSAIAYINKEKKRGKKCIGCPMAGQCVSSQKERYVNDNCRCETTETSE